MVFESNTTKRAQLQAELAEPIYQKLSPVECVCQRQLNYRYDRLPEALIEVRSTCAALKRILLPESIWPEFKQFIVSQPDRAFHQSMLLLALGRGYLQRMTFPIHRYLLTMDEPRSNLANGYMEDLSERWWQKQTEIDRHQKSRGYMGKLTELQLAAWLEGRDWQITNLEAWKGPFDIEAWDRDGTESTFEVKYIGQEDIEFFSTLEAFQGTGGAHSFSPYDKSDYLLFRVYEAAKKLEPTPKRRIAVVVISELAGGGLAIPIQENWMKWESPRFFCQDPEGKFSPDKSTPLYPNIHQDVQAAIGRLQELWLVNTRDFSFERNGVLHR